MIKGEVISTRSVILKQLQKLIVINAKAIEIPTFPVI
ncbi:unknown protein [Simkania negevensis Z]|uniref:Uncharacterized protein n=1 Tax=Simkania negevensis (strain ATCC VR-1471 / DSM 27360 / Z) TaxID=331113 RepID=F8L6D0_SIMNZ|nr:unknown protein [Simkania negevensis Z]